MYCFLCQKGRTGRNKYGKPDEKPQKERSEENMIHEKNITKLENIIDNLILSFIKKYKRRFYERNGFIYDSLQDSQEFKKIEEKVDKKVDRMLKESGRYGLFGS